LAGLTAYLLRDPLPHFRARHSSIASVSVGTTTVRGEYTLTPNRVVATSGLAVDMVVRRAIADSGKRLPLVVILGGPYKGHESAGLIDESRGIMVVALSYPFTGDPRPDATTFLREIPKIRAAFHDTPPAVMLALDHLRPRPDVDTTRIEAIGVSLGAPFMCIAGALDPRISRVWAIHGSGGSYAPLEMSMRRTIRFAALRAVAATIANVIIAGPQLDPTRWVGRIAPRAFAMLNASDDERLPRASVDALYRAAGQPKEQLWMSGAHVHGDSATINRIVEIVAPRIRGGN
jgi:dienelactone hydrolase